jgi:hypothetical protein
MKINTEPLETAFKEMTQFNIKDELFEILETHKQKTIDFFFNIDFFFKQDQYTHAVIDDVLSGKGYRFTCVESIGGDEAEWGSKYYTVYEFTKNKQSIYVKFDGYYASYSGSTFTDFKEVNPAKKTITVYE